MLENTHGESLYAELLHSKCDDCTEEFAKAQPFKQTAWHSFWDRSHVNKLEEWEHAARSLGAV